MASRTCSALLIFWWKTPPRAVGWRGLLAPMFVQAITWWLENGRPTQPRQIADQTARIARVVMAEANSWQDTWRTTGGD
jgi:hypothetical protein